MASGRIYGPYTIDEVLVFIGAKRIRGSEEISFEGEFSWRAISSEPVFFDKLQEIFFGVENQKSDQSHAIL